MKTLNITKIIGTSVFIFYFVYSIRMVRSYINKQNYNIFLFLNLYLFLIFKKMEVLTVHIFFGLKDFKWSTQKLPSSSLLPEVATTSTPPPNGNASSASSHTPTLTLIFSTQTHFLATNADA